MRMRGILVAIMAMKKKITMNEYDKRKGMHVLRVHVTLEDVIIGASLTTFLNLKRWLEGEVLKNAKISGRKLGGVMNGTPRCLTLVELNRLPVPFVIQGSLLPIEVDPLPQHETFLSINRLGITHLTHLSRLRITANQFHRPMVGLLMIAVVLV